MAENLEQQQKITNLTKELDALLQSLDEQAEETENLRLTAKHAQH